MKGERVTVGLVTMVLLKDLNVGLELPTQLSKAAIPESTTIKRTLKSL